MIHTIIAYMEDKPGVLNRVASLFRRRGFNIESLAVGHTNMPGISRMTLMVNAEEESVARRIEANLYKLVNVLRVDDLTHKSPVARELALIKVKADGKTRSEIVQIADIFRANIVDTASQTLVLEISGTAEKVTRLLNMLEPFTIIEVQRTGVIAIQRGDDQDYSNPPLFETMYNNKNGRGH